MKNKNLILKALLWLALGTVLWVCVRRCDKPSELESFLGSQVFLPENAVKGQCSTMVIYYNPGVCSTCQLGRIGDWHYLLDSVENVRTFSPVFIFSPSESSMERYFQVLDETSMPYCVVTDTVGMFEALNPNLPRNMGLHTFLLDGSGRVVLAGNPLHNNQLWSVYRKYVLLLDSGGGKLPSDVGEIVREFLSSERKKDGGLAFSNTELYIGTVSNDRMDTIRFEGKNITSETVKILYAIPDCDCMDVALSCDSVKPKETVTVTVSLEYGADQPGHFRKSVFLRLAGCDHDVELAVSGQVLP